jgi:hypothetical protein
MARATSVGAGEPFRLKLEGEITDGAQLAASIPTGVKHVIVDAGGLSKMSFGGVYQWVAFITRVCTDRKVAIDRCPPILVQQFKVLGAARANAQVRTVLLPYYCEQCQAAPHQELTLVEGKKPEIAQELPCMKCGGVLKFDDAPDMYDIPPTVAAASGDPLVGTVLDGRYELKERIGSGAVGVVYRAAQVRVNARDVAIKLLTATSTNDNLVVKRFEAESRIIGQLRHPNTLKLIDYGRAENGRLYIVTEFLIGEPLDAVLKRGTLSPVATLSILRQVVDSLAEAHGLGIIHRDLKPANIFLEHVGDQKIAKVLDFGLAKDFRYKGLTTQMTICGTAEYIAPEVIKSAPADARSDYYSLGAIAYECLAGRPVVVAPNPTLRLAKAVFEEPDPLIKVAPQPITPRLSAFVMRLLAKEPTDRPQSIGELRADIDRLLEEQG